MVSVLLAGCAADATSSGCTASMTTSPDWVFSLLLSSGLVALLSGGAWVAFLPGLVTGPPRPAPKWWAPGGRAQVFLSLAFVAYAEYNVRDLWTQAPDWYIQAATYGVVALILGGVAVAARRRRATGVWPSGRQAPWGFIWVLPVIFLVAAGSTHWAFDTMFGPMVPVPCP